MNYYQELTLIDGDKRLYEIWSIVYHQLHIAMTNVRNMYGIDSIGVSFPHYKYEVKDSGKEFAMLGNKLRIFAPSKEVLDRLELLTWLDRINTDQSIKIKWQLSDSFDIHDYVHIKGIKEVGDKATGWVSVHRYRFKPMDIQAQSLAQKMQIGIDDAMAIVAKRKPEMKVPFIRMFSESNKTHYPLQILQQPCDKAITGSFNVYGMNGMTGHATVPHW